MASKSRAAQEKLAQLEKDSAPFGDQLVEAARFIGTDLDYIGRYGVEGDDGEKQPNAATFHGREEWLLRWLLKRLQSQKENIPRKTPAAWRLLCHTLKAMPVVAAARILQERKFVTILRQTLEEAKEAESSRGNAGKTAPTDSSQEEKSSKASRKRKRSGELVSSTTSDDRGLEEFLEAIFSVISYIQLSTKPNKSAIDDGRGAEFSAEAMRSVLRATAEDAAKILGHWLSLSCMLSNYDRICQLAGRTWLSHFKEVWELHATGTEDLMQFSLYSSQSLISLLRTVKSGDATTKAWIPVLEELVARNIMIPAKAAHADNPESDLIGTLTRVSVITDSANAPLHFEIAIRSVQPQGTRRRRPEDDTWLQTVFNTLVEAMPPQRHEQNSKAMRSMLQSAIHYKVGFELPILRAVTSSYALHEGSTNWDLLHTIIMLDANVFLIPNEEKNLLQEVLTRITAASTEPAWEDISSQVVSDVVLPLMSEFANARDLSGFIRHWYAELTEFETLRKEKRSLIPRFSAWEDDALQMQLSKLLEPSLTLRQIAEILDFLEDRIDETSEAVCVLLEAIAGSVTREDVVDAVQLRLYHLIFDDGRSEELDERYKWRSWRILSRTLSWATNSDVEKVAKLWKEQKKPFDALSGRIGGDGLFKVRDGNTVDLESLEFLRTACAAWDKAEEWTSLRKLARASMLSLLQALALNVRSLLRDLQSESHLGDEVCGSRLNAQYRGVAWTMWACAQCVFVEYPKALELGLELPGTMFRELMQEVFWIASASLPGVIAQGSNSFLRTNPNAFPDLWESALLSPVVQNNEALIGQMIDIMLLSETNIENPLAKSPESNAFAIRSLSKLPLDVFARKDRKRIRQGWLHAPNTRTHKSKKKAISGDGDEDTRQSPSYELTALNPGVLALKVKIMQLPTSYEGMRFEDLVQLADALDHPKSPIANPKVNLAEFKKLAELTLMHMTTNLDQSRSQEYVSDTIAYMQKPCSAPGKKSKADSWDFASATLFQVLLSALSAKEETLDELNLISRTDLKGVENSFKNSLVVQMRSLLKKPEKLDSSSRTARHLELLSIIDVLTTLGVDGLKLTELIDHAKTFINSLTETDGEVASRLGTFISGHARNEDGELLDVELKGDTMTTYGRQGIIDKANALVTGKSEEEKLELVQAIFGEDLAGISMLDKLLAARHVISTCKDARRSSVEDEDDDTFDLSTAYSMLCGQLWKANSVRQFSLIVETMEMMLRTKGRAMSQWNIDSTLGSITILCSQNGPALRSSRAGNIHLRLCHLFQAILTDHRLKLQGHFHLVVQSMQALLRCLFVPLPHTTAKSAKLYAPPPWLSSPQHQLKAVHAAAFTRLVTSICDPSVSSVTRSQHNSLTSATDKAKRMAGQHMQFVLMTYIKLQLEMKMLPEVREKMVPGLYAIFDTTTPELRRAISESLDSSGRAVFGTLYRDYAKFGKWKGS